MTCDGTGTGAFVGANNGETSAAGIFSGVLSGVGSEACGNGSSVAAGGYSVYSFNTTNVARVANVADGEDSFIGAGDLNWANGSGSFVGAGGTEDEYMTGQAETRSFGNAASGIDSFVGAGDLNQISSQGNGAFIGAGGYEFALESARNESGASPGNQNSGIDAFIGAGDLNQITSAGNGSFIGAGGYIEASEGNNSLVNSIAGVDSFIGAGDDNTISMYQSFIAAGQQNGITGKLSSIGAGLDNAVSGTGSFIGAGGTITGGNNVAARDAFIGGGDANVIGANSSDAFIGGGESNLIGASAPYATIVGGGTNTVDAAFATVGGGYENSATGSYSTVPGGYENVAAGYASFAAGYHAKASHNGSFVWSDYKSGSSVIADTGANQFVARASGGVFFYSNEGTTSGVELAPGSGAWASLSDRSAKTGIAPLDEDTVLSKVAALPVTTWRYKTEAGVRHIGPMAQDFYAAFGIGEDDRHITSIDEDGVALSAIKALHRVNAGLKARIVALETRDAALARQLEVNVPGNGATRRHGVRRPNDQSTTTLCANESGTGSFIGANNGASGDAGEYTGVLSGVGGQACATGAAVFGGGYAVYDYAADFVAEPANVADSQDSFIAGGDLNWTDAIGAFIGAGGTEDATITRASESESYGNTASGDDSFLGAGDLNEVTGTNSFLGAGGYEFAASLPVGKNPENDGNQNEGADAFIGAGDLNLVDGTGAFVGAGGFTIASTQYAMGKNSNQSDDAFIGAGDNNGAGPSSFVGAGQQNGTGKFSFAGAGEGNGAGGEGSFVGAGGTLSIGNQANPQDAFVGAGDNNAIDGSATAAVIGGGRNNSMPSGGDRYATIGGGEGNTAKAADSTVIGGFENESADAYNMIAGGYDNLTNGHDAFAGGYQSQGYGSFIWTDYVAKSPVLDDSKINQFVVRASGGTTLFSNEGATSGVKLAPGSGAWSNLSDRNAKFDIAPLDADSILAKVARLPVTMWQYKTEPSVEHAGPMAQDFYAAFGVGEDDRHITSIDEDGVTLAAIKALRDDNARMMSRLGALSVADAALEQRIVALEATRRGFGGSGSITERRRRATTTTCSGEHGGGSFIGASNGASGDLGLFSGVLSGVGSQSCGSGSAVAAGGSDSGASVADGSDSFIGAGDLDTAVGAGSFVGAGGSQTSGNTALGTDSFIGAGDSNATAYQNPRGNGAFIGAGTGNQNAGTDAFIGAGDDNIISSDGYGSFIGAGAGSSIEATDSFIGAGTDNSIIGGYQSAIGAGESNSISDGKASFIGAGESNSVAAAGAFIGAGGTFQGGNRNAGRDAFIGAGDANVIAANSSDAFIGGGMANTIAKSAPFATILGGESNEVEASYAAIFGGADNVASGSYAVVLGGYENVAHGIASLAGGRSAKAEYNGSFVWGDYDTSSTAVVQDTAADQFVARASGGVNFYSNEAATSGVELPAGGGSWMSLSDRNAKSDIRAVDDRSILAKLAVLPVSTWRYRSETGVRHLGPMAQDFYAAFGIGEDDRHITSIDEAGVALSAIKALYRDGQNMLTLIDKAEAKHTDLERRLDRLQARP